MSEDKDAWARHYLAVWQERSGDPRLPDWLRVACLAYGSHHNNGHARFKAGQIALILGRVDPSTGVVHPSRNVTRAIDVAVEYGWLAPGSYHRCLIVPAHAVRKGKLYAHPTPCPLESLHRERTW